MALGRIRLTIRASDQKFRLWRLCLYSKGGTVQAPLYLIERKTVHKTDDDAAMGNSDGFAQYVFGLSTYSNTVSRAA